MKNILLHSIILLPFSGLLAQYPCPEITSSDISPDSGNFCPGDEITLTWEGINLENAIDCGFVWSFSNPEGIYELIPGISYQMIFGACVAPEILYVMVDPDDDLVGGPDDCNDEFVVLYIGGPRQRDCSGGPTSIFINQIQLCFTYQLIGNYCSGSEWSHDYTYGNTSVFNCGIPLGPDDYIPENSILIIQTSPHGTVSYDLGELCNLGIPIYVIAIDTPEDCTGGFIPNSTDECSSCALLYWPGWCIPGGEFDYGTVGLDYDLPSEPVSGWGISNTLGGGEFGNVVPDIEVTEFYTGTVVTPLPVTWQIPGDFCLNYGPGTYNIVGGLDPWLYSICPDSQITTDTFEITISCPIVSAGDDVIICEEGVAVLEGDLLGSTGSVVWTTNGDGEFGDPSLVETTYTPGPNDISNGQVVLTLTFTSCETVSDDLILTIVDHIEVDIEGIPSSLCITDDPIVLPTMQDGIMGTWSGEGVLNNVFDPQGLNGTITLTFTPEEEECAQSASVTIEIESFTIPEISGIPDSLCELSDPIILNTEQDGIPGNWSGEGVSNNAFTPMDLSGSINLTFTPDADQCAETASAVIQIIQAILPEIAGVPASMCEDDNPISLPTNQDGVDGHWSGPGVTNNVFDPAGLDGIITILFTPDPQQCASPAEAFITVITCSDPPCPSAGLDTTFTFYPSPDQAIPLVDLLNIIGADTGGTWDPPFMMGTGYYPCEDGEGPFTYTQDNPGCPIEVTTVTFNWLWDPCDWEIEEVCWTEEGLSITVPPFPGPHPDVPYIIDESCGSLPYEEFDLDSLNTLLNMDYCDDSCTYIQIWLDLSPVAPGWEYFGYHILFLEYTCDFPLCTCADPPYAGEDNSIDICIDADPFDLTTSLGGNPDGGGYWTPPLNSGGNIYNPILDGTGIFTYTVIGSSGCPDDDATVSVTVIDSITPMISGVPSSLCENDNPFSLSSIQDGTSGNWSGQGVSNNTFDPSGLNGSVTLTFTPDAEQCAEPASTEIDVLPSVTPVISGIPDSLCQTDNAILLPTTLSDISGDWSGQGVSNNMFNPAGLNGDIVLTFTPDATQCAETVTTDITVESATIPLISGIPDSMCQTDDAITLPTLQDGFPGDWSGSGVINNIFNPAGLSGLIALSFTPDAGQCAAVAFHGIDVVLPIPPVISGIPSTLCEYSAPISLPTLQNGIIGNWTGQGVSSNTFDPVGLIGDIVLTFTPDAGQCATIATTSINVVDIFVPQITGVPSSLCELSEFIALPIVQDGVTGDWSGPGVANNTFDPAEQSGVVTLTFTPGAGQCADTATTDILIEAVFTPVITGVPDALCQADSTLLLPTIVDNIEGTWSGQGVIDNMFNPAGLLGEIPLLFTPGDNQCAEEAAAEITVYEVITPFIQGIPDIMCQADGSIILPTENDGITGNWTGAGVTNNTFDPSTLSGLVILTFIPDAGQCADEASEAITVSPVVQPEISGISDALCQGDDIIALPDVMDGISGNWFGPGVLENMFDPEGQFGAVTITFIPDEGECSAPASADIIVHTSPAFINLNATCDSITQTYTVSFDIQGGDPLSYTVNGNPAGGSSFSSAPISADSMNYAFILDDVNGCGPVEVIGSVNCACATHAGTMSFTGEPMHICEGSGFTVMHLGNAILDTDDILEYVLHDQAGTQLGTIIATSSSPSFSFPSGVNLGQVYYVSSIAGTNNGTGSVDLSDECLSVSQGVPVLFYKPEVAISAGTEICADECVTYTVLLSGVQPFVLSYQVLANDTSFIQSLVSNTESATFTLCPASFGMTSGTLDIQPLTLSDANCIVTPTPQPNVATTIHGHSLASISHGICPGESINVNGILYDQSNLTGTELLEGANAFGCDSVIEINLWALEPAMLDITRTLCDGASLMINGNEYNADRSSGIEVIPGGGINGCDSIITISLSFDSIIVENITPVLCADESMLVNGTIYDITNPTGTELIPGGSASGCDSVINIELSFYPPALSTLVEILCPGDSLIINGTVYDKDHVYGTELIPGGSIHGCDSIIEVSIDFYPEAIGSVIDTLLSGDSIVVAGVLFNALNPDGTVTIPGGSVSGCDSIVEVVLNFRSQLSVLMEVIDPVCPGESGAIILEELYGGSFPLTIVLDGSDTVIVSALPHILQNLDGGIHDIWVRDAAVYTLQMQIAIQVPSSLTLDAGIDQIIVEGSNTVLHVTANFEVISWQWFPPDFLSCTACTDPIVIRPDQSVTYTLIATDLNGCTVSDAVTVSLEKEAEVFIPNVFTPNGDGVNDTWTLYSEDVEARIQQLVIYDRWGGILFSRKDVAVNDPAAGWDGSVNGSQINPGVYVFRAELVTSEGKVTQLHGDVTLFW